MPKNKIRDGHKPPLYWGYKGAYANLTKCEKCGSLALMEDQYPNEPCVTCGGKAIEGLVGRWRTTVYSGFFMFKTVVRSGHWELRL